MIVLLLSNPLTVVRSRMLNTHSFYPKKGEPPRDDKQQRMYPGPKANRKSIGKHPSLLRRGGCDFSTHPLGTMTEVDQASFE
jgi:hypothetical protein